MGNPALRASAGQLRVRLLCAWRNGRASDQGWSFRYFIPVRDQNVSTEVIESVAPVVSTSASFAPDSGGAGTIPRRTWTGHPLREVVPTALQSLGDVRPDRLSAARITQGKRSRWRRAVEASAALRRSRSTVEPGEEVTCFCLEAADSALRLNDRRQRSKQISLTATSARRSRMTTGNQAGRSGSES